MNLELVSKRDVGIVPEIGIAPLERVSLEASFSIMGESLHPWFLQVLGLFKENFFSKKQF